ncbi:MAG: hypothetical protein ACOYOV_09050 [Bacteroidales bacterium]
MKSKKIKVLHIDGMSIVIARIVKEDPVLEVEYKFQGMTYGLTNPKIINN